MIMGVGIGIMGMANASLGGGSLTGKMLAMKFGISFSLCTFVFDAAVYPFFYYLYGWEQTLFSLILTFCSSVGIFAVEQFRRIPGLMQHKVSSGR
ncbi:YitT family protein [Paenibacillus darwinianus]